VAFADSLRQIGCHLADLERHGNNWHRRDAAEQMRQRLRYVSAEALRVGLSQVEIDAAVATGRTMPMPPYVDPCPNPHRWWRITNLRTHEAREIDSPSWLEACGECRWEPSECRVEGPRGWSFAEMAESWVYPYDDSEDGYWAEMDAQMDAAADARERREREEARLA
jgi:hypothetical protein